ncbi:MAG: zinc-ribbon domain-containing protein, partial [Candidatus Weimeria sp.]
MYCRKCGKQINDDAKFCKYCGTPVKRNNKPGVQQNRGAQQNREVQQNRETQQRQVMHQTPVMQQVPPDN